MALRGICLLLLLLVISWRNADARASVRSDLAASSSNDKLSEAVDKKSQLCTMCEQFASQATEYLSNNKTQTEIIETLHQACAKVQAYEDQCIMLVDYYASIFFVEISKIEPDEFCEKVNLCADSMFYLPRTNEICSTCQEFVIEVIDKLNSTDTQMEVVVTLLKGCSKVEHYATKCKKLVLQYAPLILVNGAKFLQNTDVCNDIHACKSNQETLISSA